MKEDLFNYYERLDYNLKWYMKLYGGTVTKMGTVTGAIPFTRK